MTRPLCTRLAVLALGGSLLSAAPSFDTVKAPVPRKDAAQLALAFPSDFRPEQGVSWDGRIGWKAPERVAVFAVALELSLKEVVRPDSPFHLSVTVVRAEKRTGTFVVEFAILDPTGESVESVQVEGVGPTNHRMDEVYPAVAGQIVATFKKNVLQ
ncbi:hypothetical protein GETHPA_24290 [Geothrix rubra]|uniref:Uncharacterized protein n=1 Tax=Geothrix rubra TaxID=2927977 RepID=A0ABQ5Q8Z6_9BACT|nr:hypothetical protein [Geothrix rubra]GLH70896.1 hypothetical protein GETHPA_24290 [Geothrix rubra]